MDNSKPTIPEVMPLVKAYRDKPGNNAGGNLHIVLDDVNISDSDVRFCLDLCIQRKDEDGARLCNILLSMSRTQRNKISRNCYERP